MRKRSNQKVSKEDSDTKFEKEAKKQAAMEGKLLMSFSFDPFNYYSYVKQRQKD